jgi:hypothetical protein
MAVVSKSLLRKALDTTELVDPQGLTPFVALHLQGEPGTMHIRRTGAVGYVESEDAPPMEDTGWSYVSFGHLKEGLKFIESDDVEIVILGNGGVQLRAVGANYETEIRVHTVDRARSAFKKHTPGACFISVEPTWLRGLNTKPFVLACPPVILEHELVLLTQVGVIRWATSYDAGLPSFPRESFLKAISGLQEGILELSESGYYRAVIDGLNVYTGGHRSTFPGSIQGEPDTGVELPANRLLLSLKNAAVHSSPTSQVNLSSKLGITAKDLYNLTSRWSMGDLPAFPTIGFSPKVAKLLTDALEQEKGEVITFHRIHGHPDKIRLVREGCSVTFSATVGRSE